MADETNTSEPKMSPPDSGVKVRMYRPRGLGDCFLLAFRANDGAGHYMLIDCGVFFGTAGGADRMKAIAADIEAATGGRLHLLVASHEHWDHLSGFQFAQEIFDRLTIDEIWVAWTEDDSHPLAGQLREKRNRTLRALTAAVASLKAANDPKAGMIEELLNFHGEWLAAKKSSGTAEQMQYLLKRVSRPSYRRPGEPPITWPEVAGIKIYVLGPPEDEELLTRSDPSRVNSEVYEIGPALNETTAFYAAALAAMDPDNLSFDDKYLRQRSYPFDNSYRIPLAEAEQHPEHGKFFQRHYGFRSGTKGHGPEWRRIDADWLAAAEKLALQLDSDTNNTSLALAIELVESRQVLLFPADAQVGNWLSWQGLAWAQEGGGDSPQVTGADLLRRTVFYKVGHHASHNATLRQQGLELMQSPDLVAMIPVDEAQAAKKEWAMPFSPLLERLQSKTRGRILRADRGLPERPASVSPEEWDNFLAHIGEDPGPDKLWIEYTVSG